MKIIKQLGLAGVLASTLAFGGCAETNSMLGRNEQTWTLRADTTSPGVTGKVQVANSEKGNRDLKVAASHLAPPDTAFPGMTTYVVWLKPENGHPLNIGVLSPDNKRNAELKTKTPFTSFEIVVTAENGPTPMLPGSNEVASAKIDVAT